MALTVKVGEQKSQFQVPPEDNHLMVCYGVVDLGTIHDEKYNKDKHEVMIMWELPECDFEIEKDGKKVKAIHRQWKKYNLVLSDPSSNKQSNLTRDLVAWRGKAFTAEELSGFDLKNLLAKACLGQIVHNENEGKTYANIATISRLPKGMTAPKETKNPIMFFDLSDCGGMIPDTIPEHLVNRIKLSKEWIELTYKKIDAESVPCDAPAEGAAEDDLPF